MIAGTPRYDVLCRLSSGGMGDLHLARFVGPAGFERLLVVKRLPPRLVTDPEAAQALIDEARIAATLSHTNIVQVHDVEIAKGQVSIVMEFLHGRDVQQLLQRLDRALPLDQAVAIILGVLAALHHAHECIGPDGAPLEIVHRDVSPHNVFITFDGAVKLVDFGIARAATRLAGQTADGIVKGKPGYMAPEQLRGRRSDRRADVWSAGVLLYEMATGVRPFPDEDLVAPTVSDAPPPSTRAADVPASLDAIVGRALARDPAERYATALDMQRALEAFARARALELSQFGLAKLMEGAFQLELSAWRTAERAGFSLAEHIAGTLRSRLPLPPAPPSVPSSPSSVQTGNTKPLPAGKTRAPLLYVGAALVATSAVALVLLLARSDGSTPPPLPAAIEQPAPPAPGDIKNPTVAEPAPTITATPRAPDPVITEDVRKRTSAGPKRGRLAPPDAGAPAPDLPTTTTTTAPAPALRPDPDAPLPR